MLQLSELHHHRGKHDRVAFAVHAVLSVNGFRLVATGPAVETYKTGAGA